MATREEHGAKGHMWLKRDWYESSSTHIETYDDIEIQASEDGQSVILTKSQGEKNFIRTNNTSYFETKISISVDQLVHLIEKHGRQV